MKSTQAIGIRFDENAWIELQKSSMRPFEALWKENDSPFSLTIPSG